TADLGATPPADASVVVVSADAATSPKVHRQPRQSRHPGARTVLGPPDTLREQSRLHPALSVPPPAIAMHNRGFSPRQSLPTRASHDPRGTDAANHVRRARASESASSPHSYQTETVPTLGRS